MESLALRNPWDAPSDIANVAVFFWSEEARISNSQTPSADKEEAGGDPTPGCPYVSSRGMEIPIGW